MTKVAYGNDSMTRFGAIWTCPMHPEIRQADARSCPICGMTLEPEAPSREEKPNPQAKAVGSDTMLSRIVRMVAEAQRSRAPIQALADRISGWFVPLVILIAMVAFAVWSLTGPEPRIDHALLNAIAVLIIACPCALGLAKRHWPVRWDFHGRHVIKKRCQCAMPARAGDSG